MQLRRHIPTLAIGSTVLVAAALSGSTAVLAQDTQATYRVTIVNVAPGQPLTPPVVVLHNGKTQIVEAGAPATAGLQQLAENGNNAVLTEALTADSNVGGFAEGTHPIVAGGIPGAAQVPSFAAIEVSGDKNAKLISVAAMMICTNDGFAIVHDEALPKKVGSAVVYRAHAYDAGTEINTEDFANMVPPCQPLVGISTDDEGVGMSDPALAENGVITPHPGIAGGTDLDVDAHAVAEFPAIVVVERIA